MHPINCYKCLQKRQLQPLTKNKALENNQIEQIFIIKILFISILKHLIKTIYLIKYSCFNLNNSISQHYSLHL